MPTRDSCTAANGVLFDHIICNREQRVWHGETERLGGLEIDDALELGRLLHRQVGWIGAAQDTVDIRSRAIIEISGINSVRQQTALKDEIAQSINRRQAMASRQRDDQLTMKSGRAARNEDEAPSGSFAKNSILRS